MFALQRVLAAVNTAVAAAIGTHNLFTLLDLERLVLSGSKDFEGVSSFEQLKLGPLRCHPLVRKEFPRASLTVAAAESAAANLTGTEVMQALAAAVDANWTDDPNAERTPFSMDDALQVLARSKGLASVDELPIFMRRSSHFVTGMLVRFTAARHRAEKKAEAVIAMEHQRAIERGKQQGAVAAMRQLEEEAREKERERQLALKAAAKAADEASAGNTTCATCRVDFGSKNALHDHLRQNASHATAGRMLGTLQALVADAQARGVPAEELVEAQLMQSWLGATSKHRLSIPQRRYMTLISHHAVPVILALVEKLAAGREQLQADLLAEGADILAQLGSSSTAGSAPPARTAEALLDHVRSLHADLVADGADVSPLVLLATIEQRLRARMSEEAAAARHRPAPSVVGCCTLIPLIASAPQAARPVVPELCRAEARASLLCRLRGRSCRGACRPAPRWQARSAREWAAIRGGARER